MNFIRLSTVTRREIERFLRIPIQTFVSPWISATLYLLIFGVVVGGRIDVLPGIPYINFVLPGILLMQLIFGAFGQSSTSLFFMRWTKVIEEMLTSPLSYMEMILGFIIGAVARALVVGSGIYLIALFFTNTSPEHLLIFFFYVIIIAVIFSLVGLLIGLWSEKFEHLSVLQVFVLTPLLYLSGIFNTIEMLPESIRWLARLNPFFYMVDGLRFSMISYQESNLLLGTVGLSVLVAVLFGIVWRLFARGWKLRS